MRRSFTLLICFIPAILLAQKTVYFSGFELINMPEQQELQYSSSKLIKAYIEDNHDYTIFLDDRIGNDDYAAAEPMTVVAQNGERLGSRYLMTGEIHFLDEVCIVSLGVYETKNQKRIWHNMVKGVAEKDLDLLLSRLGRAFMTNKSAKTDIEIDEVTDYDEQGVELAQIRVNHYVGAMLGGKYIPSKSTLSGIGLAYSYDASTMLFNLDFEFFPTSSLYLNDDSDRDRVRAGSINLGVIYPFTRKRTTLFVQGGMEYGFTTLYEHDSEYDNRAVETGIGVMLGGGLLINRNSTVNVRLFTAMSIPFYQVDGLKPAGIKFGLVTSFAKKRK